MNIELHARQLVDNAYSTDAMRDPKRREKLEAAIVALARSSFEHGYQVGDAKHAR